mgnify:CR=1 FL=1
MLRPNDEAARCLLCANAPCTAACPKGQDPARSLRSLRFENPSGAGAWTDPAGCAGCGAPCEAACIHYDTPIRIRETVAQLPPPAQGGIDLGIDFCGVHCENPFFLSSSVVASGYAMCAKALGMGWAGLVYKTVGVLTPEEASPRFAAVGNRQGGDFYGFRNIEQISDHPLERDLAVLKRLKQDFPNKVIVGSIMGSTDEEWTQLARMCTEAGCDLIECNFSCPHMTGHGLGADVGTNPELVARYTACVKRGTHLPVLAKMTPNLANMELPAIAAVEAGADGLAAINTIKSITGLVLPSLAPAPAVDGKSAVSGYSGRAAKPIALRFIYDLAACPKLQGVPLSGMGGYRDLARRGGVFGPGLHQPPGDHRRYAVRLPDYRRPDRRPRRLPGRKRLPQRLRAGGPGAGAHHRRRRAGPLHRILSHLRPGEVPGLRPLRRQLL